MVCNKCNRQIPENSEFCQHCGSRLPPVTAIPAAQQERSAAVHQAGFKQRTQTPKKAALIILGALLSLLLLLAGGYLLVTQVIIPAQQYRAAENLLADGDYKAAEAAFLELGNYSDASAKVLACRDARAIAYADSGSHNELHTHIKTHGLSVPVRDHISSIATDAISQGDYTAARALIPVLSAAPEAQEAVQESLYQQGLVHYSKGEFDVSNEIFAYLGTYKDSSQKIHEHQYTVSSETAPTCDAAGVTGYICTCGAAYEEAIPANGHSYSEATCSQAATCSVCGGTSGTAAEHTYSSANCTKPKTCSVCGKTDGEALGHLVVDGICTRCGVVKLTLAQLQGTWKRTSELGYEIITVSGSYGTVEWCYGSKITTFSGTVQLKDYGFYIAGTYQDHDINGNLFTANIRTQCYISKFTEAYFVDTFDNISGPYTWYKQSSQKPSP